MDGMKYISPRDHGCEECRDVFDWDTQGREVPGILQPAEVVLAAEVGGWSKPFHRCRNCKSWWSISYNPKDMISVQTAAAPQIARALRADATLDQAWPFLFAPAPIDEQFENYLYQGRFAPQAALDQLLNLFRNPAATPINQADILRMVARLLSLQNPEHRALQKRQGWVWKCPRQSAFSKPLLEFERRVTLGHSGYQGYADYSIRNLKTLREVLERDASKKRQIFTGGTPSLEHSREDWQRALDQSRR
jgi:hypothetical protein